MDGGELDPEDRARVDLGTLLIEQVRDTLEPDELGAVHRHVARTEVVVTEIADRLDHLIVAVSLLGIGVALIALSLAFSGRGGSPS